MLEDKFLVRSIKGGDGAALRRVYEKYGGGLLMMATVILRDIGAAEDVLHDVFVSFVKSIEEFELTGNLRAYLAKCVANRAKDILRAKAQKMIGLDKTKPACSSWLRPEQIAAADEESQRLALALDRLPFEQRQVITLHLHGEMRFREIAQLLGLSINTIQGRYRYGIEKLRTMLNETMNK